MQFKLNDNLGTVDARKCNHDFGTRLETKLDSESLLRGAVVDLTEDAAMYLGKRYPALLEPVERPRAAVKEVAREAPKAKAESESK